MLQQLPRYCTEPFHFWLLSFLLRQQGRGEERRGEEGRKEFKANRRAFIVLGCPVAGCVCVCFFLFFFGLGWLELAWLRRSQLPSGMGIGR